LAGTEVDWSVTSKPTNYTPPIATTITFGKLYAWWRNDESERATNEQSFKGRTDAEGKHTLKDGLRCRQPGTPFERHRSRPVQDVNRQTLGINNTLLVHPADVYVGLKSARSFVQKGQPFDIATIVTDLDGKALAGRDVRLRLVRLE
jgi:hypothetical protein